MPFLKIHSSYWVENWTGARNFPLKLNVIRSNGVNVTLLPNNQVSVNYLNKGTTGESFKQIYNRGSSGISFKVNVVIHQDEIWKESLWNNTTNKWEVYNPLVTEILELFYRKSTILEVTTDFIDIPNGKYVLTKIGGKKQTDDHYTVWDLEFTSYVPLRVTKYKNDNTRVKKAVKSATAKKVAAKTTSAKKKTTTASKFSKCNLNVLVYSKTKKTNDCVKQMQNILSKAGFYKGKVDGWFGSETTKAVKKFQEKYKKTYSLKVTGKVDKKTFEALQVFKTGKAQTTKAVSKTLSNALKKA